MTWGTASFSFPKRYDTALRRGLDIASRAIGLGVSREEMPQEGRMEK